MYALADGNLSGMNLSQLIMLVLAVIGLTIVMRSTLRRVTRTSAEPQRTARALYADLDKEGKLRRNVEQVMIELDQLARQVHGRLDTRFAKLETVIRDADDRIDRLSRLIRLAEGAPAVDLAVEGDPFLEPSEPSAAGPAGRYDAVYRLADGGLSAIEIAQEVGTTTGEIELILSLRKTRARAEQRAGSPA